VLIYFLFVRIFFIECLEFFSIFYSLLIFASFSDSRTVESCTRLSGRGEVFEAFLGRGALCCSV